MAKPLLWGILIFVMIGSVTFFAVQSRSHVAMPQNGTTIVAFGDSLVEGVGAESGGDFPSQLEKVIGEPIVNAGRAGHTTADALARLDSDVLDQDPKIVIVLIGGNDALRNMSPQETFSNIESIVSRIRSTGSSVILIGVRGGIHNTEYKRRFKEIARAYETAYIPDVHDGIFRDEELMADSVHPNTAGYAVITKRLTPVVEVMLGRN